MTAQERLKQAMQFHHDGDLQKARSIYARILESSPDYPDALHLYGLVCHQQGEHEAAVEYIRRAVELVPDQPVLRNNLGDALRRAGHSKAAIDQLKIALELRPGYAGAHQNMGSVYADIGNYDAALFHTDKSVECDPSQPEAWFNLGLMQLDQMSLNGAVDSFRKALDLRPHYQAAATSLLYTLNLLPGVCPDSLAREHIAVANSAFGSVKSSSLQTEVASREENKKIRIGYISGDFCTHAVNYFFEPVLEHHDTDRFETYCYSDVAKPDRTTQRLKKSAKHWRDIVEWEDHRVTEKIRSDRIDILVDLAGHTKHHRLGVFAEKAAACQVTWLGFPNTSGLEAMDYRVVDQYTAPGDELDAGSERLLRLPRGFACFRPPGHAPSVQPSPVECNGFVTLGSLHKMDKLNDDVITLWAEILREIPTARLLLIRDQLDEWQQQRLQTAFSNHGIGSDRLKMVRFESSNQTFFDCFAEIDIMLDSFPWSGHTLACCALWMGVPVVSLYGDRHAGRMVASVLDLMGLDELVAKSTQSYTSIVRDLCKQPGRLTGYRAELRGRFERSPLRDETGFTRTLETEFSRILNI